VGLGVGLGSVDGREVLREAEELDSGTVADFSVDTSGLSVADVARQVLARTDGWPVVAGPGRLAAAAAPTGAPAGADGPILWLCGTTGVGKSTVGFTVYQKALRAGQMIAYLDLDQIDFHGPALSDHRARACRLADMADLSHRGSPGLVMVGPVDDEATVTMFAEALPAATITLCRLHAGRDQLTKRIMQRGQGGSWSQPGYPLKDQSPTHLLRIADQAVLEADALESAAIGMRIDTNTRTAEQTADLILAHSGWPHRHDRHMTGSGGWI
jgi:hypothetical protein